MGKSLSPRESPPSFARGLPLPIQAGGIPQRPLYRLAPCGVCTLGDCPKRQTPNADADGATICPAPHARPTIFPLAGIRNPGRTSLFQSKVPLRGSVLRPTRLPKTIPEHLPQLTPEGLFRASSYRSMRPLAPNGGGDAAGTKHSSGTVISCYRRASDSIQTRFHSRGILSN